MDSLALVAFARQIYLATQLQALDLMHVKLSRVCRDAVATSSRGSAVVVRPSSCTRMYEVRDDSYDTVVVARIPTVQSLAYDPGRAV